MAEVQKSAGRKLIFGLACLAWIGLFLFLYQMGSGGMALFFDENPNENGHPGKIARTPWTEAILLDNAEGWEWVLPGMNLAGVGPVTPEGKINPQWSHALAASKPSSSLLPGIDGLMVVRRKMDQNGSVVAELLATENLAELADLGPLLGTGSGYAVLADSGEKLLVDAAGVRLECRFRQAADAAEGTKGAVKGWLLVSRDN